jgi:hypothetical protein
MKNLFFHSLMVLALGSVAALTLSAQGRVFSKTGTARVEGRDVLVHVTVAVPPGVNTDRTANNAIRAQGGIPLSQSEYSFTGLVWDEIANGNGGTVVQRYNPGNDATGNGVEILNATQITWSDSAVTKSAFKSGSSFRYARRRSSTAGPIPVRNARTASA